MEKEGEVIVRRKLQLRSFWKKKGLFLRNDRMRNWMAKERWRQITNVEKLVDCELMIKKFSLKGDYGNEIKDCNRILIASFIAWTFYFHNFVQLFEPKQNSIIYNVIYWLHCGNRDYELFINIILKIVKLEYICHIYY